MRAFACVLLAAVAVIVPGAGATSPGLKLLVRDGSRLALVYLDRPTPFVQPLAPRPGVLGFSGDGRLMSVGGTIVGRATLPGTVVWGATGERAAAVSTRGGVVSWTPAGKRRVVADGWGAQSVAWSDDGALAIGRLVCPHHSCAYGEHKEIWVSRNGSLRRLVGPLRGAFADSIPMRFAWSGGHVLWWQWPGSGSVAADGVALWKDGTRIGTMLMYRDWLVTCGAHVAFVSGTDRESMDDKRLIFDGRDLSGSRRLSWAEPACTAGGRLVAAASRNLVPPRTYETHRALWQVLPTREQLTRPPWGWSDEDPHLFANGDVLFVRTRARSRKTGPSSWTDAQRGHVMLLSHGKLTQVATIGFTQPDDVYTYPVQFYGHYDWSQFLAVAP